MLTNPVTFVDFSLDSSSVKPIDFEIEQTSPLDFNVEQSGGGVRSYKKLKDKPSINGTELVDNYDEIDPTVPDWAKEANKPEYTSEEIGAIDRRDEMSLADIKAVWDSVFKKEA